MLKSKSLHVILYPIFHTPFWKSTLWSFDLQVILRTYQVRGAFPGGPPERACGLTDTWRSQKMQR